MSWIHHLYLYNLLFAVVMVAVQPSHDATCCIVHSGVPIVDETRPATPVHAHTSCTTA